MSAWGAVIYLGASHAGLGHEASFARFTLFAHSPKAVPLQVGIVTLMTPREVAAEAGVSEADIDIADERVGAVVVTGSQLRCASRMHLVPLQHVCKFFGLVNRCLCSAV
jgi:hypothetical protein